MNVDGLASDRPAEGVAVLQLATDAEHAIGAGTVERLRSAVAQASADRTVRAVVVTGGTRYFSSGAAAATLLAADPASAIYAWCAEIPRLLLAFPVPTVAAMAGHAVGGGFIIGLWCDTAVLAEESMYGANFMALGFTPGMGTTAVLPEALGAPLARELLYTGRMLKGRELRALPCPLSHAVVARAEVHARAVALAAEIARVPHASLALLKERLTAARRARLEAALEEERAMHERSFAHAETRALLQQHFGAAP